MAENPFLVNPRWAIADRIGERVRRRYAGEVRAVGVHGSLAHGDDADGSDVDLVVVTYRAAPDPRPCARRIDGIIVNLGVIEADEYLRHARTLSMSWPLAADRYVTTKQLYDPDGWFDELRDAHLARLAEAPGHEFAALAREAWCRGASSHAKATRLASWYETDAALVALSEARVSAAIVKGLLTRTYFRNSADAVRRTGVAGTDVADLGTILANQAEELARRGRPVDADVGDLFS